MPTSKLSKGGALTAMRPGEGNNSIDTFIGQGTVKEPLLPFSRTAENPVQWIQLLHALDQPDLPGWPLLTPLKIQMHKCEKCSQEFCSTVNYRRHIRMHRRSLSINKESHKSRDLLAAYWDKLSLEEAKEVVSFDDVMLKGIPGSSIIGALDSSLQKPGVWIFPQVYVNAGSRLLEVIHAKPSRLPISAQELFSILDDASEGTFLRGGTAGSVQTHVFDEETAKNSLEMKNVVACTSFLFEQQLIKAWVAHKDVEALRYQKLLVDEEEAAQRRQAKLLERKKQKKLRQKKQKLREQLNGCKAGLDIRVDVLDEAIWDEASSPSDPSDSNSNGSGVTANNASCLEFSACQSKEMNEDFQLRLDFSSDHINIGADVTDEPHMAAANAHQHLVINHWQFIESHVGGRNSYHGSPKIHSLNPEPFKKFGPNGDMGSRINGSKVWTKKVKVDNEVDKLKHTLQGESSDQSDANSCNVMIGSISVPLSNSFPQQDDNHLYEAQTTTSTGFLLLKKNTVSRRPNKADDIHSGINRAASKVWRPVSRGEDTVPAERDTKNSEVGGGLDNVHDRSGESETCTQSCSFVDDYDGVKHSPMLLERDSQPEGFPFSSIAAREFLANRWKEAISGDHVKLILPSEPEPPDVGRREILHDGAYQLVNGGIALPSINIAATK